MVILYMATIGASVMALAIGSYLYFTAASKCIKESLLSIGCCATANANQHILAQIVEFIQFHSRVKQLSKYQ